MRLSRFKHLLLGLSAAATLAAALPAAPAQAATEMEELAVRLQPGDFTTRVEKLIRDGRAADALELADLGLARNARNVQLRFERTVALERLGRTEDAARDLKSMIAQYPELPEPYNNLAAIEAGLGNYEEALTLLKDVLRINPNFALARKNLGDVYIAFALESYESAAPAFEKNDEVQQRLRTLRRLAGQ